MLASFGVAEDTYRKSKGEDTYLERASFFYNAPPFSPNYHDLVLDITPFILYDKVYINKAWLDHKGSWGKTVGANSIMDDPKLAELIRHGIIEPHDYEADTLRHIHILEAITQNDISNLDLWREAIRKSFLSWQEYLFRMRSALKKTAQLEPFGEVFKSQPFFNIAKPYRLPHVFLLHAQVDHLTLSESELLQAILDFDSISDKELRYVLESYLLNINNNLLLSRAYSVGVLDWFDFEPFYINKLMLDKTQLASDTSTVTSSQSPGGAILSYYLPLERINSVQDLLQAREKAKGLREYLDAKQMGDSGADERTLLKILWEIEQDISQAQKKVEHYQKIASYFTLPISLIPLAGPFIEKITKEIVDWQIEKKFMEDYRWHFSLLDMRSKFNKTTLMAENKLEIFPTATRPSSLGKTFSSDYLNWRYFLPYPADDYDAPTGTHRSYKSKPNKKKKTSRKKHNNRHIRRRH